MENSNNCCIYITKYKRKKCNYKTILGKKLCYKHAKYNKIEIFELLNDIFYNNINDIELINIHNINKVFDYINNKENDKKLFIKIIDYLYSVNGIACRPCSVRVVEECTALTIVTATSPRVTVPPLLKPTTDSPSLSSNQPIKSYWPTKGTFSSLDRRTTSAI